MAEPTRWPGLVPARARRFAGGPIECRGVCRNLVGVGQAVQQVVRAGFSVSNRRATRRSGNPSAVKKRPVASRALPDRRLKITMCESPDSGTSRSTRWPGRDGMRGRPICSGRPRLARGVVAAQECWRPKHDHAWSSCSRTPSCRSTRPLAAMSSTGPRPWPPDPPPSRQGRCNLSLCQPPRRGRAVPRSPLTALLLHIDQYGVAKSGVTTMPVILVTAARARTAEGGGLPGVRAPLVGSSWGIELRAGDGHLGRVLPKCEAPDTRPGPRKVNYRSLRR
jgi:hypothetical protein